MVEPIFFDGWHSMVRILVVGLWAYVLLIAMLRVSGKRTLSKMNAFDLIVTVALGSTFATVLLDDGIPLAEGLLALGLLVGLQFAITWLSVRSVRFKAMIKSNPTLLVNRGCYLEPALKRQRVTHDEIGAALRESGFMTLSEVNLVVLESDGSMTVVAKNHEI